jgi:hypothetical protein
MAKLPPLARTVTVGGTWYKAGDTPPLYHAKLITNPRNWEGEKVPDFEKASEPKDPATGVTNSDAAVAAQTSLPGPNPTQTGSEGTGTGEGDGTGAGTADSEGTPSNDPAPPATGSGTSTTSAPTKSTPRKATSTRATS